MRVGSLCSGAGGFDLGFHRAGYRTAWACEIDPWRRALLQRRFGCPVHPDIAGLDPGTLERVDVLIGGTPCQDLSVAGQRAGLDGERSGLFWHFMRVRNHLEPEWTVWENVAGALSSNDGLDFASVLAAFVGADVLVPGGGWPGAGVAAGPWGGCVCEGDVPMYTLDREGKHAVSITGETTGDRCAYDPQPDGRRYAACGDGVVAHVAEWIARRIAEHGEEA